ncbi:MAG TPA: KH domain-containing protein [Gaiellaceae bacterium]|nr:KH domain-containing protein [Gaiellaceae bacterium]
MADLLVWLARQLVDNPDAVRVEEVEREDAVVLQLYVADEDRGEVIGRAGRIARALRTIVRAAAARERRRVVLEIVE